MWLAILLLTASCPGGETPVETRALDTTDLALAGAEVLPFAH
jgi:hypothetical protein